MTDGVARELEQAEERLEAVRVKLWDLLNAELRSALENGKAALSIRTDIVECIERDWPEAAIEVGRLRALALPADRSDLRVMRATQAVEGVLFEEHDYMRATMEWTTDRVYALHERIARVVVAALAAREEVQG